MKYKDFKEDIVESLEYYNDSQIDVLWIDDFYDGMLSGICDIKGKKCKAEMISESSQEKCDWYRKYIIIELTEQQYKEELYWHNLFLENVGNHWDNTSEQKAIGNVVHSRDKWDNFYIPYKEKYKPNFNENKVVGWYKI